MALGDIFWPASEEEQYPGVGILYQKGPETLGQSSIPREFLLYLWKIPGSNIDSVSPTTPPGPFSPIAALAIAYLFAYIFSFPFIL